MNSPIISIITPVYNAERHLKHCINSILAQKQVDWELLLIDDGSIDESGHICDYYAQNDQRIHVVHKENGGASSARNVGLDRAKGDWICFIDADDTVSEEYVPLHFEENVDMYVQQWKFHGEAFFKEQIPSQVVKEDKKESFLRQYAHFDTFRGILCKFIKRSIVEKYSIRFNEQLRLGEDTLFFMEYESKCSTITVLTNGTYYYRRESEWNKKYSLSLDDVISYYRYFLTIYDRIGIKLPKLVKFIYAFFRKQIEPKVLATNKWRLHPDVLKMEKHFLAEEGVVFIFKFICKKVLFIMHKHD